VGGEESDAGAMGEGREKSVEGGGGMGDSGEGNTDATVIEGTGDDARVGGCEAEIGTTGGADEGRIEVRGAVVEGAASSDRVGGDICVSKLYTAVGILNEVKSCSGSSSATKVSRERSCRSNANSCSSLAIRDRSRADV
jgi:hypothetical protein